MQNGLNRQRPKPSATTIGDTASSRAETAASADVSKSNPNADLTGKQKPEKEVSNV